MTRAAYRLVDGEEIVYVLPYSELGRRVVYRQDPETFDTRRETVGREKATRLAERGREVALAETPAWCDTHAPRASSVPVSRT